MNWQSLWFVLAGIILGFALSTLWEWLYFRRRRLVDGGSAQHMASKAPRPEPTHPGTEETGYQGPSVLLESEEPETLLSWREPAEASTVPHTSERREREHESMEPRESQQEAQMMGSTAFTSASTPPHGYESAAEETIPPDPDTGAPTAPPANEPSELDSTVGHPADEPSQPDEAQHSAQTTSADDGINEKAASDA